MRMALVSCLQCLCYDGEDGEDDGIGEWSSLSLLSWWCW